MNPELFTVRFKLYDTKPVNGKYTPEEYEINNLTYEEVKDLQSSFIEKSKNKGMDFFEASLVIIKL